MKKIKTFLAGFAAVVLCVSVATGAEEIANYDFADYGTSFAITNTESDARVINRILMRYDSAGATNTLTISRVYDGVTYRVDTEAGTNVQDDKWEPASPLTWGKDDVIQFSTTVTNLNLLLVFEKGE